jgi:6-phosphogluconolactonase
MDYASSDRLASMVKVLSDPEAVAREGAQHIARAAEAALARSGRFTLALSGGRTPRALHAHLLAEPVDWGRTVVLFGDERCVAPDHPESNFRMARETLLDHLPCPPAVVVRMEGERPPEEAARRCEQALRSLFPDAVFPRPDLVVLGMGADGHTASLFPGTTALQEKTRWVVANHVPQLDTFRLTLTVPVLQSAAELLFLVTGKDKAPVFAEAFGGRPHPVPYPCELVGPLDGVRTVLADAAAASELPEPLP